MNKYNVLFIFVDSVRRYNSDDDRGRLKVMDEFSKNSVECLNVVTSAPSTFMSISAMMSGMPAYFLNRNYNDFIFNAKEFDSLPLILKQNGYSLYNFWMAPISRVTMNELLPCVPRKYWPKGFKHSKWWSNSKINELVKKTLNLIEHHKSPSFFFVNYHCRDDEKTSDIVAANIELFREYGYTEENTITILCSDHGYPDPSKETGNPSFYKLNNVGHDLVLTDDNIMIPFAIQYPGCEKVKIESTFSTLDIFPTILDILCLNVNKKIQGQSILPVIENNISAIRDNNKRFFRCDSRLAFQKGKGTAIRNGEFKYIYYHDNFFGDLKEEFFDIQNDRLEENNLINSTGKKTQTMIDIFRNEFKSSEENANSFQEKYLLKEFKKKYFNNIAKLENILIVDSAYHSFINMLARIISEINKNNNISILNIAEEGPVFNNKTLIGEDGLKLSDLNKKYIANMITQEEIDLIVFPTSQSKEKEYQLLLNIFKELKLEVLLLDYNLSEMKKMSYLKRIMQSLRGIPFLIYEPINLCRYLIRKLLRVFS